MLEIMEFYGKQIELASMRGISWHVVVFSGKRGVYANSLSGPLSYMYILNISKTTSTEEDLNRRRPKWKTT